MKRLPLPDELKVEFYPKRIHESSFDRIDLIIMFLPGKDDTGAVVKSFIDAISVHDIIVKSVEEKMESISALRRVYHKKSRLFRNLDSAWNIMLDNPVDFYDYIDLLPKMKNITVRLEQITDSKIRAEVLTEYNRFQSLHDLCSKQLIIYETYSKARAERDESMKILFAAEAELVRIRDKERQLALRISDDHVLADEMQQSISSVFPNVHGGHILTRLNGEAVELLPFDAVMRKISRSKSPHLAEFQRYDFRFNPISREWKSLDELRQIGVCLEDPMLQRVNFVNLAAVGDSEAVGDLLLQGFDPNGMDYSGSTALHLAAANRHSEVVELLVKAGGDVNSRDKNMMTPLLFAVSCGYMEMVRLLVDLGADRDCSDKNHRNTLYYAVLSGNEAVLRMFLRPERCNEPDKLWGFTPLHLAANQGSISTVKFLVHFGCSFFRTDLNGRTAEEVAKESGHLPVAELLAQERLNAAGQLVHRHVPSDTTIWIGDQGSLDPLFVADLEFTVVVFLSHESVLPLSSIWLRSSPDFEFHHIVCGDADDDAWANVNAFIQKITSLLLEILKKSPVKLLICDDTCEYLSPSLLATTLLLKYQIRIKETLQHCVDVRPSVSVGASVRKGLDQFQKIMDDKVLKRLDTRLRNSNVVSSAF